MMGVNTTNTTRITKTSEGEYRVRLFIDGIYQAGADYFASDRKEAQETAKLMEASAVESDKTTEFANGEAEDFREESGEDEQPATQLYDVCNDYSLDQRDDEPADLASCEETETAPVAMYHGLLYWNEHGELVYFRGAPGLKGKEL